MNGTVCLDSSIVVRCLRGDLALKERFLRLQRPVLTGIALGELYVGAFRSNRTAEEIQKVEGFAGACQLIFPDRATAPVYGRIKVALRLAGTPIPENDIWIAALCVQHGWELAFRDRHFPLVPGLRCLPW